MRLSIDAGLKQNEIENFIQQLPPNVYKIVGGDTACIEVRIDNKLLILDAGTGFRRLGLDLLQKVNGKPISAHILLSHLHIDHINGIPFFVPGMLPGNKFLIYSTLENVKALLQQRQLKEYFPIPLPPAFEFIHCSSQFYIDDILIETIALNHPGGCTGFRITYQNKILVYASDSEYKNLSVEALQPYTDFFKGADVLIFDAQYTMLDNINKEDWGHSNIFCGIDMALEADVKQLVFTHHEPTYADEMLWKILLQAREYLNLQEDETNVQLLLAYEGLEISL